MNIDKEELKTVIKEVLNEINKESLQLSNVNMCCGNCKNFYQHYGEGGGKINCGHCGTPRIKHKSPMDKACSYWESK